MMNQQQEIPVYLFTGFLGGGKTTFIQDILSTTDFNEGERTLLLLCEEGEEDYDPSKFSYPNVYIETIEDEEDLTQERLKKLEKRHAIDRVVIEYNGMWMPLQTLFQNMPQNWLIYHKAPLHDATTFLMYNHTCASSALTRCRQRSQHLQPLREGFDKDAVPQGSAHRQPPCADLLRIRSGRCRAGLIEDPLPYDMEAPRRGDQGRVVRGMAIPRQIRKPAELRRQDLCSSRTHRHDR